MGNDSYDNDFDLHENETPRRTHFPMKGFALTLVSKQIHKRTRKWPIEVSSLKHAIRSSFGYYTTLVLSLLAGLSCQPVTTLPLKFCFNSQISYYEPIRDRVRLHHFYCDSFMFTVNV